jgi:GPH family glycoside/pentoside/hexuronide:cation symporter
VGIGLSLLGASGYRPDTVQSDGVVFTLRVLYSLVPSLCNAVAILIALAYPITGEMHARIREAISAREGGNEVDDPLSPGKTYQPGGGAPH